MDKIATNGTVSLLPWFTMFIALKWFGTSLVAWSWWWVLWPSLPIAVELVKAFKL